MIWRLKRRLTSSEPLLWWPWSKFAKEGDMDDGLDTVVRKKGLTVVCRILAIISLNELEDNDVTYYSLKINAPKSRSCFH